MTDTTSTATPAPSNGAGEITQADIAKSYELSALLQLCMEALDDGGKDTWHIHLTLKQADAKWGELHDVMERAHFAMKKRAPARGAGQ